MNFLRFSRSQKGQNKVEISNLPGSIDTESARVNITGLNALQLFDVVCTKSKSYIPGVTFTTSTPESIRVLEAKKSVLIAERDTLSSAMTVLEHYSKTLKGEDISPEQADKFLDTYVKRMRKLVQEAAELQEQIQEIDKEIRKEKEERSMRKGSAEGVVSIVVMSKREMEAEFKLIYSRRRLILTHLREVHVVYSFQSFMAHPGPRATNCTLRPTRVNLLPQSLSTTVQA